MRLATVIAAITCLACAAGPAGPAAAQSKEDLRKLSAAYKLIEEDATAKAIEQLNGLLEAAPEIPDTTAKAMLLRGQAYAKAGRPAQALADFDAALWLQGLSSGQRKDAVAGRKAALAKLGLEDPGGEDAAATAEASSPRETGSIPTSIPTSTDSDQAASPSAPADTSETVSASAQEASSEPATGAWQTDVQTSQTTEAEPEESDGGSSFFSDLFGGGSSDDPPEQPQRERTETAAASGWSTSTTDAGNAGSGSGGRQYRVQIASVGTRDGAESEVRRLSRLLGNAMDGETANIVRMDTEAGNTYYRIVVGPKPSRSAAQTMCQDFKARGVDCLVVSSR